MLNQTTLNEIAELTNDNHHTAALSTAAHALGLAELVEQLDALEDEQDAAGHLTEEMRTRRHGLSVELFCVAKARMTEKDFVRFSLCF